MIVLIQRLKSRGIGAGSAKARSGDSPVVAKFNHIGMVETRSAFEKVFLLSGIEALPDELTHLETQGIAGFVGLHPDNAFARQAFKALALFTAILFSLCGWVAGRLLSQIALQDPAFDAKARGDNSEPRALALLDKNRGAVR
jgi:hypothetical protein